MLYASFQEQTDSRRYCMLAIRGTGTCMLSASGLCKSKDHIHSSGIRYGYDRAAEWVSEHRNDGWHVLNMDRMS